MLMRSENSVYLELSDTRQYRLRDQLQEIASHVLFGLLCLVNPVLYTFVITSLKEDGVRA